MNASTTAESNRWLVAYYAATAVFLVLDYGFHLNLRVVFLEAYPFWRGVYYGICMVCLLLIIWRPALSEIISGIESLATLIALIMSVAIGSMIITDEMIETGQGYFTTPLLINFLMSCSVAYYSWSRSMKAVQGHL